MLRDIRDLTEVASPDAAADLVGTGEAMIAGSCVFRTEPPR